MREAGALSPAEVITDPRELRHQTRPGASLLHLDALYRTRVIGAATWSPEGTQVAFVANMSGRNNLWRVATSGSMPAWPEQLTFSEQRQSSPAWSPDGAWIAFVSDQDGDEQWDIFLVSTTTGEVRNLTQTPEISEEHPVWSPDGRRLAYIAKPRSSSVFEIAILDLGSGISRPVTQGTAKDWGNYGPVWSPDGRRLAFTRAHASGRRSEIHVADLERGLRRCLTERAGEEIFEVADWSPDGKSLLTTSDAGNGFNNVALLEVESGQLDWLTNERWEMQAGNFSPDGRLVAWSANVDGQTQIQLLDRQSGAVLSLPLPPGVHALSGAATAFAPDGRALLLHSNGPASPGDLRLFEFDAGRSRPLTSALVGGLRAHDMVEPALVHYPSHDGRWTISAWAYVPHNLERDGRAPALVYVHGGPAAQAQNSFQRLAQYFASRGYLVIAPNYRGSTGYGKAFHDANYRDLGGGDLQDVVGAAAFAVASGYADSGKIVLCGGSYGGYLTMMGLTQTPERWAAGVAIVPFVNWFTEIANEDPLLREYDLATMGDPETNAELLRARSPIFFIDRVRAPVLLLAGGNDPRCPRSETEQVVEAIRARGGIAEAKIYDDEGHGFARVENMLDAYGRVAAFLERYVGGRESRSGSRG